MLHTHLLVRVHVRDALQQSSAQAEHPKHRGVVRERFGDGAAQHVRQEQQIGIAVRGEARLSARIPPEKAQGAGFQT